MANKVVKLNVGLGVKNIESPFDVTASIASPDFKPEVCYLIGIFFNKLVY